MSRWQALRHQTQDQVQGVQQEGELYLEAAHVAAVSHLGLRVAADDLERLRQRKPLQLLLSPHTHDHVSHYIIYYLI
jgi:hypothetical protein